MNIYFYYLAGKECHKNYFVVSWQNDSLHESAGQNATNLGYKKAFILAPNYPAGKDALTGFKRFFKGEIVPVEIKTRRGSRGSASSSTTQHLRSGEQPRWRSGGANASSPADYSALSLISSHAPCAAL